MRSYVVSATRTRMHGRYNIDFIKNFGTNQGLARLLCCEPATEKTGRWVGWPMNSACWVSVWFLVLIAKTKFDLSQNLTCLFFSLVVKIQSSCGGLAKAKIKSNQDQAKPKCKRIGV